MSTTSAPAAPTPLLTAAEFQRWVSRPENQGRWWELDQGRIVEVPPPQAPHGTLCGWVAHLLWAFAIARGRGRVTTNDTGLIVEENPDTVRGVDVMFFDTSTPFERIPVSYESDRPALVVEVRSPSDRPNPLSRRIAQYLARGIPVVWVVDPEDQTVGIHRPGELPVVAYDDDELTGFDALPDLRLRAADLFTLPGQSPSPTQP
jgi:Uma2 family endonuclease